MKNSSFALECVVTLVLLMQHFISDLSPVTKTALMACTILIWLITGIMLLVKKDRRKPVVVTYIIIVCAIVATVCTTFGKVTLKDLFIDSEEEHITSVSLRSKDGTQNWTWYPSEEEPVLAEGTIPTINGGSADELLRGLGEISAQNYWLGPAESEEELTDIGIHTSGGNTLYMSERSDGTFSIHPNNEKSLHGKWVLNEPLHHYIPSAVMEYIAQ